MAYGFHCYVSVEYMSQIILNNSELVETKIDPSKLQKYESEKALKLTDTESSN